jgi:hypothetical protein
MLFASSLNLIPLMQAKDAMFTKLDQICTKKTYLTLYAFNLILHFKSISVCLKVV